MSLVIAKLHAKTSLLVASTIFKDSSEIGFPMAKDWSRMGSGSRLMRQPFASEALLKFRKLFSFGQWLIKGSLWKGRGSRRQSFDEASGKDPPKSGRPITALKVDPEGSLIGEGVPWEIWMWISSGSSAPMTQLTILHWSILHDPNDQSWCKAGGGLLGFSRVFLMLKGAIKAIHQRGSQLK